MLRRKSAEIQRKIQMFQVLDTMVRQAIRTVEVKVCPADMEQVDQMVRRLYQSLVEDENNEE